LCLCVSALAAGRHQQKDRAGIAPATHAGISPSAALSCCVHAITGLS
jgi:hypothetical protein